MPAGTTRSVPSLGPSRPLRSRLRLAAGLAAAALALGALTLVSLTDRALAEDPPAQLPTRTDARLLLAQLGLGPEALAAAGLSPQQASALVDRAEAHLGQNLTSWRASRAGLSAAASEVERLERLVRAGRASSQDKQALASARTQLAGAQAASDAALASARAAVLEGVSSEAVAALDRIRANRSRELPTQYLVVDRIDGQWVELRDALANLRIAERKGWEESAEARELVTRADADPAVVAAKVGLGNRAAVEEAWKNALPEREEP